MVSSQVAWIWASGRTNPYVPLSLSSNVYEKGMPMSRAQSLEDPDVASANETMEAELDIT